MRRRPLLPVGESLRVLRRRMNADPLRDATPAEIVAEHDIVLEAMIDGAIPVSPVTLELARAEFAERRADVARRHGGGLAPGGGER